ncbi:MAG: hypothetical protein ACYDBB_18375 [Armatimonadota bacterium]
MRWIGFQLVVLMLCCASGNAATASWQKAVAPADLRIALSKGGNASLTTYRGEEVLQADLSDQRGASTFGEAALFNMTPGKYRATFRLSIQNPPVGRTHDMELAVMHGNTLLASRPLDLALLPADGSPAAIPLTFILGKSAIDVTPIHCILRWTNHGDLTILRHHGMTMEQVSAGPAITQLQVDKLIYQPGQKGVAHVRVQNYGATSAKGAVVLSLIKELADRTELAPVPFALEAGAATTLDIPFTAPGEWGVRAEAVLTAEGATDRMTDYYSVTDNYFAVGIGYPAGPIQTGTNGRYDVLPARMRADYANMLEVFFWAPCDWAKLTSTREEWWSGQTSYHETEKGLQSLIARSHDLGIKVAGYCSQNAAGPEGWEVARRHPEWFYPNLDGSIKGGYSVFDFDHWNDPAWRAEREAKKAGSLPWYALEVDLRKLPQLDYGIDQIIASRKQYGWDAMRFDGHYRIPGNDEMSARNMRRLKERVAAACPELRLGYNYGYAPDYTPGQDHEVRELMAGGGLYMQEAIRSLRYAKERYTSWKHFASNELRIAKLIQSLGGYYHCIWDLSGSLAGDKPVPERGLYIFIYGTIAGGHPYYGTHQDLPGCTNWGAFLTRWSGMLWDRNLRVVAHPETQFAVEGQRIEWQPFVQERVVSPTRKFVILHLVTPPASDSIDNTPAPLPKLKAPTAPTDRDPELKEDPELLEPAADEGTTATPPPWNNEVIVRYTPPAGTKVECTMLVQPEATPFETALIPAHAGEGLRLTVPHPRYWSMVILELSGQFPVPPAPPQYSEPPDPAKLTVTDGPPIAFHHDPLKPDIPVEADGVEYVLLDRSSCNIGNYPTSDPDSDLNVVQWRQPDHTSDKIGIWWALRLEAGKYRCSIRLKWTDAKADPTPQWFRMYMIGHEGVKVDSPTYVTPGFPNAPAGARTFGERGKYQYYDLGVIELKNSKLVTFDGYAGTAKTGDNVLYADRIRIEPIERYTDAKLAEWNTVKKPAGLRTPQGSAPKKILQVKGLFWQQYGLEKAISCDSRYDLYVNGYEDLYAYDAIVLVDYDFYGSDFTTRKRLRDFVEDGGRLVVLGGPKTLGYGRMRLNYIEDLLPVTLKADHEVARCEQPLLLGPAADTPYPDKPALFWLHEVTPRQDAKVLAYAGTHPIAFSRTFGKGRVFVFSGTVLGEGTETAKPFWECASWTALLKRMVVQ